ncbi:hypothetical protein BOG92_026105 [Streptomyces sp. WAC00263]|nr:hypothetical protein BOG92_026105 [Streptomyces sp. WAC00263]
MPRACLFVLHSGPNECAPLGKRECEPSAGQNSGEDDAKGSRAREPQGRAGVGRSSARRPEGLSTVGLPTPAVAPRRRTGRQEVPGRRTLLFRPSTEPQEAERCRAQPSRRQCRRGGPRVRSCPRSRLPY